MTLDAARTQALEPHKRATLAVALISIPAARALDDLGEMFVRRMQHIHNVAKVALERYRAATLYVGAMFGVLGVDIFTTTAMRMNEALQIRIEPECFLEVAIPAPPKAVDQRKRTALGVPRDTQGRNYRVDDPMELGMPKVPNVPSSIGHVAGGWRKEELLNRANDWARRRGYESITEASLFEWRQPGLLPGPRQRTLGRGKGSAQYWSWLAYRRLLKIAAWRAHGIRRRRKQRLYLWLDGSDIDVTLIKEDLARPLPPAVSRLSQLDVGNGDLGIRPRAARLRC